MINFCSNFLGFFHGFYAKDSQLSRLRTNMVFFSSHHIEKEESLHEMFDGIKTEMRIALHFPIKFRQTF